MLWFKRTLLYFAVSSFRSKLCFFFALSTIGVLRSAPCYTKVQHGSTSLDIQDQRHATPCMYHDPNLFRRSVVSYDRNSDTLEPSGRPGFQGLVYVSPVSLSLIHRSIEIPDSIQMLKCIKAQQQMIPLSAINLRATESLPLRYKSCSGCATSVEKDSPTHAIANQAMIQNTIRSTYCSCNQLQREAIQ
jgi:hypothetical protein